MSHRINGFRSWIKHAFAVPETEPPLTPEQAAMVRQFAQHIVNRRLAAPALAFLEMSMPLNYLGSQTLQFLMPIASGLFQPQVLQDFATFLERRDSLTLLQTGIELAEDQAKD